ncbi:hypothetical protein PDL02_20600 [Bacillus cereus group sp. LD113LC]|nr:MULTISPECIES: ABC-three component system middle component 1 [unclassified Bacillus cereus group]MDQ4681578.1 hypothetical protein [Stenotrophomonas maltophilia group sp. RNC7]HDX9674315.1 hypothetical protein [Bacillus cereus]MDA1542427.1 hypothetical protein [Bacillus cereus group sp. TH244-1LC]MDA1621258.1 hypothetical protein [Bacillus cereus group sp. TH206-1LC]MDA1751912.1 hypothetical protein [Bacillus cereus group sp. LD113LC]
MDLSHVIENLTNIGYDATIIKDSELNTRLRDRDIEVWNNNNRYIVTKGYSSEAQLSTWLFDQIIISFIYDSIPTRYRNNLYFLLVVEFENSTKKELSWKITEIEKNDRVCRKYVIESMEDLKRVPALNNNFMENKEELFDFEKEFKNRLFTNSAAIDQYGEITQRIKEIVDVYFEKYDEQDDNATEKKILIKKIIERRSEEN